ncbi:putative DNA binding protein [Halovivax ruber XH-70]|uniref:Putative DNA binding protein n=1 Tax=Halovivax ruber (strain DSM 18193 / JCM 13892 / XH-70) TaxID=797302 RepID=L0IB02_HALRX|nr:putative DNA binding protein [Halovivax ruber XH-70]
MPCLRTTVVKSLRIAIEPDPETVAPESNLAVAAPAIDRQLILGGFVHDSVESTISYVDGDPDAVAEILRESTGVETYEITRSTGGCYLYQQQGLTESALDLFEAFFRESIVVLTPYELRADGSIRMTVVGDGAKVQAVIEEFPDEVTVEIVRVGDSVGGPASELSARQREAVSVAWDCGYYEVPRETGIERVAAELDCAISTASDLIRRAESRLVANALDVRR